MFSPNPAIANLDRYEGEFEFTNLLNCTLGLIILPYEKGIKGKQSPAVWSADLDVLPNLPSFQIHLFKPIKNVKSGITIYDENTLEVLLKKLRNGLAHQNVWPVNQNGEFSDVVIKNYFDDKHKKQDDPDLHIQFSKEQLKDFALFIANEYLKLCVEPVAKTEPITDYLKENIQSLNIRDEVLVSLVNEYEKLRVAFEPLRQKMTKAETMDLFARVECSHELLVEEKAVAYFALDAILDGSFPPADGLAQLGKAFGPEFVKSVLERAAEIPSNQRE
jgi:hypothetical protein